MTDHQPPENADAHPSPFTSPEYAELVEPESIERESLSWGGRFAWIVIALVVGTMITVTALHRSGEEARTEATTSDLFPVQLQARSLVGQKSFPGAGASATAIPDTINDGTYEQRLCYVLLVNENQGHDEAANKLDALDSAAKEAGFELNEDQSRLRLVVGELIKSHQQGDFDAASVSDEDREFVKDKLGWIGELGLVPAGTRNTETRKELLSDASWSIGLMMGFMLLGLLTLAAGVALAAVFAVLFATRKLQPTFSTRGKSVNIYIETFALWIVFFFGGPQLIAILIGMSGIEASATLSMLIQVGFFFGSLIVLIYPLLRGISFRQLCDDIGWKTKGGFVDMLVSPLNYIAGTPLMLCGLVCVLLLTFVGSMMTGPKPFGTSIAAGHPIQEIITGEQWWSMLYVVVMACIAAPIVEETMFRGVLYRHLRELSGGWARWGSVVFSALFNGLIFAAIHPQGFTAIPLLTCLAINFSLAREWRDSLIAPIIMHAINNGGVTFFMFLMMS